MSTRRGDKALRGEDEYLSSHYFEGEDETRWLTGRGELITVYDPTNIPGTTSTYTTATKLEIPKGYVVEVIRAWVKITR
ncbi:uncharacterized protein EI97DRAFT_431189 [Westerdykella ornata]|uniref:Uncharacterized protein n=1 Tax=Westerdykella ornata TaxID=318751 RepID=A0A6A6JQN7_WESOR|nr:uncharacterized protein EI97DRAFT_431189 [Westerdykella ornata]KAF2278960.1 hypothetical protein EI97DRAFT_431189 [Westerdykella ornata]